MKTFEGINPSSKTDGALVGPGRSTANTFDQRGGNIARAITGLPSIDRIIIGLYPPIRYRSKHDIEIIAKHIEDHFFQQGSITPITNITNADTSEFIEGIGILIKEQNITDLAGLQIHFDEYINAFSAPDTCRNIPID